MTPFARLDYDTACIEAATPYEEERERYETARDTWDTIRQAIDTDLERALIDTDTQGF